eukprot:1177201-Prorocentrum_minimum.AAC.2
MRIHVAAQVRGERRARPGVLPLREHLHQRKRCVRRDRIPCRGHIFLSLSRDWSPLPAPRAYIPFSLTRLLPGTPPDYGGGVSHGFDSNRPHKMIAPPQKELICKTHTMEIGIM